jgi:hypothetical protein
LIKFPNVFDDSNSPGFGGIVPESKISKSPFLKRYFLKS